MDNDIVTPMAWLPESDEGYDQLKGRLVTSSDGQEIGNVDAVFHPPGPHEPGEKSHYFLLGSTRLTGPDGGDELYMPETAIRDVTADQVVVRWTRDDLEHQGWRGRPALIEDYRRA